MGVVVSTAKRALCSPTESQTHSGQWASRGVPVAGPIYGAPLAKAVVMAGDGQVPHIVRNLVGLLLTRGLDEEGIFRVPADDSQVKQTTRLLNEGRPVDFNSLRDPHLYSALLKKYYAGLPQSAITDAVHQQLLASDMSPAALQAGLLQLPLPHYATTLILLRLLHTMSQHCSENRMTISNLATCWAPCLFRTEIDSLENLGAIKNNIRLLARLIELAPHLPDQPSLPVPEAESVYSTTSTAAGPAASAL